MTFGEICQQTARECGEGVSTDQVRKILITQWRIMLEELFIAPGDSKIMLQGIGQFYLKRRNLTYGFVTDPEKRKHTHYVFRFKPSELLKKVMAGKMEMKDLRIGTCPLYYENEFELKRPNEDFKKGEKMYQDKIRRQIKYDRAELRMAKEQNIKMDIRNRLPED